MYFPKGIQPIHEVIDWKKIRVITREVEAGVPVPPILINAMTWSLLTGTHRWVVNMLLARRGNTSNRIAVTDINALPPDLQTKIDHLYSIGEWGGIQREFETFLRQGGQAKSYILPGGIQGFIDDIIHESDIPMMQHYMSRYLTLDGLVCFHHWSHVGLGVNEDGKFCSVGFCENAACGKYRLNSKPPISKADVKQSMEFIEWGDGETVSYKSDGHKAFAGM